MDKIDRRIYKDNYSEANRELINKCIGKLDELVEEYNNINCYIDELNEGQRRLYDRVTEVMNKIDGKFK